MEYIIIIFIQDLRVVKPGIHLKEGGEEDLIGGLGVGKEKEKATRSTTMTCMLHKVSGQNHLLQALVETKLLVAVKKKKRQQMIGSVAVFIFGIW